jgi:hypothetical protein
VEYSHSLEELTDPLTLKESSLQVQAEDLPVH